MLWSVFEYFTHIRGIQCKFGIMILIITQKISNAITLSKANFPATNPETFTAEKESKAPVEHNNMINMPSQAFLQIAPTLLITIESACPQKPTNDQLPL